jgi:hypothetical protein
MFICKSVFTSVIVRQLVFSMCMHVCVCVYVLKQLIFRNSKGEKLAEKHRVVMAQKLPYVF